MKKLDRSPFFVLAMLAGLVALTGCAPTMRGAPVDYTPMASIEGLELDESQRPALIWVRPGAASFASYDRFIIDPVRIDYRDPEMAELSPENVAQLQERFQKEMIEELRDGGYEVGTRSRAGTLRISFTIAGLKANPSGGALNVGSMVAGTAVGLPMIFAVSVGEVTIEAVFRDALTNRIDAVAVDRTAGSRVLNKSPWSTWSDVNETFDIWAKGIRKAVDEAHGK